MSTREEILHSLLHERTVDLLTTGRRTGRPRTTEIWTTPLFGRLYVCGSPNATVPGVDRTPRDWLANLLAQPDFTLRLKQSIEVDLPARATRVRDPDERRQILSAPSTAYYREARGLEIALAHSPIVRVRFTREAAWLDEVLAAAA